MGTFGFSALANIINQFMYIVLRWIEQKDGQTAKCGFKKAKDVIILN